MPKFIIFVLMIEIFKNRKNKKTVLAILGGIIGYYLTAFPITLTLKEIAFPFYYSFIIPLVFVLSWGRRYAIISVLTGIPLIFFVHSYYKTNTDYLPNILFISIWLIVHGLFVASRKTKARRWNHAYMVQLYFSVFLLLVWKVLSFLSHSKNIETLNISNFYQGDDVFANYFFIAVLSMFSIVIIAKSIISHTSIRKGLMLVVTPYSKYTNRIIYSSILGGMLFFHIFFLFDNHHAVDMFNMYSADPKPFFHLAQFLFVLTLGLLSGNLLANYVEEQLQAIELLNKNKSVMETILKQKIEDMETVQDELMITNKELITVNEALHIYQKDLERMVDQKVAALQEEQLFKSTILDSIQSIVVVTDAEGLILMMNSFGEQITSYSVNWIKGRRFKETFIPEEEQHKMQLLLESVLANNRAATLRAKLVSRDGNRRVFLWTINCVRDKSHNIKHLIYTGTDLTERTMLLDALKEREESYKMLFDNMASGIAIYNPVWINDGQIGDLTLQSSNHSFEKLTGVNMLLAKNKSIRSIRPQSNIDFDLYSRVFKTGEACQEEQYFALSGKYFYVSTFRYKDSLAAIYSDISEKKRAENLLVISEEKFRNIFESNQDAMIICNMQGKILEANPTVMASLKYSKQDILSISMPEIIADNGFDFYQQKIKDIKKNHTIETCEMELLSKSKTRIPFEAKCQVIKFEKENAVLIIARDISERHRIEKELRKSEEKFRYIFNITKDGFVISNLERKILDANRTFFLFSGFNREDLAQLQTKDLVTSDYHYIVDENFVKLISGNEQQAYEAEFVMKSGNTIPVEINSQLIEFDGQTAILSILKDISYRKEMESKLIDTIIQTEENERKRFASDLHDEIGPLLSSMRMYVSTLSNQNLSIEANTVLERVMEIMKDSVVKIREISHNLSPNVLENFGLHGSLKKEVETLKSFIHFHYDSSIIDLRFEPKVEIMVYRIIKELIQNTIKHANAQNIFLNIDYREEQLIVQYHDDGKGYDINDVLNNAHSGIGIRNIINRAKSVNGRYKFGTEPQSGMNFEISINTLTRNN